MTIFMLLQLTELELIHGIFTLVLVITFLLVGLRIALKYLSTKSKIFLLVGFAWILISSAWWGSGFSFFAILITGDPLPLPIYLLLGNAFIPIAAICWIFGYSALISSISDKKLFILINVIISVCFEIFLIIFLFIAPSELGTIRENFYSQPGLVPMIFQLYAILLTIITGIIFSRKSMKSDDNKIQLKGKFLLTAFVFFTIGAFLDAAIPLNAITLIVTRLILIISAILFFIGFLLPKRIEKIFYKP
ncbi:MAG: hypothetical protein MUP85_09280 [Candidatus Lokiarchaeota archaeon]|nr:hypothetical protein [Candidatus Lokiarchaeota archaeon]